MKIHRLVWFVGLLSIGLSAHAADQAARPPNVIVILTDDLGYGDLASYGASQYATPHLDRMAAQGMRFTHYYAPQAVCSASRAGLLTGCYPNRVGIAGAIHSPSKNGLHPDETTIAEVLKAKRYRTAAIGKWHVGHRRPFLPLQQGFDEYLGLPYSNDMWPVRYDGTHAVAQPGKTLPVELPLIEGNEKIRELRTLEDQEILTTLYTERAQAFIRRNRDEPFFLYLAHTMPHVPLAVSSKFKGKSGQGMYGDVVMELDWSVGEIRRTLEECGLTGQTLVIFTSDNGPWLNYGNHAGSAGGLREGKGCTWEGGQRVPCIMVWPGQIPAGTVCSNLASSIDLLPTFAALAGAPLPERKIDGVNILPLLRGDFAANPRDQFLYYYRKNSLEAVRRGSWKLVFPHPGRSYEGFVPGKDRFPGKTNENFEFSGGLYDLRRDPGERYDLKAEHPEIVAELEKIAQAAREDLGDDLTGQPGKNRRPIGEVQ
ncbi:MAG: sulfatase [Opitutae bacterium]|nr:sulfatase [Opitutae bacterium]